MIYSIPTLIILLISLIIQWRRYRIRVLLHPSFYFLATWILSVISFEIFFLAGFKELIIDIDILNELFMYVSFTALCFIVFSSEDYKIIRRSSIRMNLYMPYNFYKYLSIIFFVSAFVKLFFFSGFNVAETRATSVAENFEFYNNVGHFGFIEVIFNIINMLLLPFIVYSGWVIGTNYFNGARKIKWIYFLTFLASLMNVIADGSRAGIMNSFTFFILGLFFALFSQERDHWVKLKGLVKYGLIFFLLFSLYTTYVSTSRAKRRSGPDQYLTSIQQFIYMKPFFGILEYSIFHFQGYQWRRIDSTAPKPEMGQTTFSFITDFSIPVVSQILGERITIQKEFHLKDVDPIRNSTKAADLNLPGASITATVYYILYNDFGFYGVFIITFLFVGFTQKLYRNLFTRPRYNFWYIIIFIAVYKQWSMSIFSHQLSGSWFNAFLYPILIIETVNYLTSRYKRSSKHKLSRPELSTVEDSLTEK